MAYGQVLAPGQVLADRYEIEKTLGQGGFGITYAAMDKKLLGRVAVKEYFPASLAVRREQGVEPLGEESRDRFIKGRRRFLEEAKNLAGLSQTAGVVRVLGCFEEAGTAYMVMEYVQGQSLRSWLEERETLPGFSEAAELLSPVCRALEQVHKKGLIHRDICPDNLIMRDKGTLTLIDFGAARAYYQQEEEALTRTVLVHQGYAPPEQYESKGKQGPWTDVYGLAATLYEMLTGTMPPSAPERLGGEGLYPPSAYGADITAEQEEALLGGLKLEVRERFQSVKAFEGALLPVQKAEGTGKKRGRLWGSLGAAAVLCLLLGAYMFFGREEKPAPLAGNYVRGSEEYTAFMDFVKANAVEVREDDNGTLYLLEEAAIRQWGAPANRYAMDLSREEAGALLLDLGMEEDAGGGWDIFWVREKGYGAISTRFDRVQVYTREDGLQALVCADIISGQVNLLVLSDGTQEVQTALPAAAELCARLGGAGALPQEQMQERLESTLSDYLAMERGYAGEQLEAFEVWFTGQETGTEIYLGRYGRLYNGAPGNYWPD